MSAAPGPWDIEVTGAASANGLCHIYVIDSTGRKIAAVWGKGAEKEATALMLSAATELLVAAQTGLSALEDQLALILEAHCLLNDDLTPRRETLEEGVQDDVQKLEAEIAATRAAITKATGVA